MRTTNMHEYIFEAYKTAGRELSLGELRRVLPAAGLSREGWRKAIKKCERIYKSRWHEIYDTVTGVVHTPIHEPEPAPVVEQTLDPLLALRKARNKREEHE